MSKSAKRSPLKYLAFAAIISVVLLIGIFAFSTVTGEADFDVTAPVDGLDPEPVTVTMTNEPIIFPPTTQGIPPPVTSARRPPTTTTFIEKLELSMSGTVRIKDINGHVLEEWQISPQSAVYESAYGVTWEVELTTRIESNIIEWWTLNLVHNIFVINANTDQDYKSHTESYSPAYLGVFKVSKNV